YRWASPILKGHSQEKTPKVLISGAYSSNHKARQTQGQLGADLYEKKDMQSVLLDGMVKYNGWAFMTAYMNRMSDDPIAYSQEGPHSSIMYMLAMGLTIN
ncbi:MAG: hypothetical protein U5K51_02700, partial [Flavobacteriaceae bacterium]|nr:hypothetical protein [Flavobacteriaceae bacterium]